jgi:hypothetical protein
VVPDTECYSNYWNVLCYVEVPESRVDGHCDTPPEVLSGQTLELNIRIADTADDEATDTLTVIADPDAKDSTECHEETDDSGLDDTAG